MKRAVSPLESLRSRFAFFKINAFTISVFPFLAAKKEINFFNIFSETN